MRRITKSALIMVGAAATTFAVFSQFASPATSIVPAAKAKLSVCQPNVQAVIPEPVFISVPTLPPVSIPTVTIPCIPVPTQPSVSIPNITVPSLPSITLPTVTLPTIPDVVIPYPVFQTTTTDPCQTNSAALQAGAVPAAC